jgi:serine/threonine protein kinase
MIDPRDLSALGRLLDTALDLPDDDARARWLAQLGPEHEALKPRLAQLLAAHSTPHSPLDRGLPLSELLGTRFAHRGFSPGMVVGPYELVRQLGRGGMSEVWLAKRIDSQGAPPVALKLPAVSLDGRSFLARFAREREFLERLNHPGIAKLIEAGVSDSGQHYLALEYVEGTALNDYCDARQLGVRDRLTLYMQVLRAVDHAHSRSILHRDLKPSNILVTPAGEVRLLDFGIAKLLVDGQASETELTELWGRALTREYASPEQFQGLTVTARSDVYALGVVLFELVCGRRPHPGAIGGARHPSDSTQQVLEPPLPSESCRADSVVARHAGGPGALARVLAGDIDAIALRALQHDAADRYPDVASMAADLQRVLSDEPVQSRIERWRFRAARALQRQRAAIAVSSLLLLAVGCTGTSHRIAADIEATLAPAVPPHLRTVLVSIGADDYQRLFKGTSPLDPQPLQKLVSRIMAGGPAVLGVDIDTSAPPFASLPRAIDTAALGRIVWGRDIAQTSDVDALPAPRPLLGGGGLPESIRSGLAVSVVDGSTGTVRWWRRSVPTAQGHLPSLAAELTRHEGPAPMGGGDPSALRSVRFATTERLELPASVVLADGFQWRDRIRDRVVLLGGRYDRADVHATARGLMSGLEILANTVETERTGRAYRRPHVAAIVLIGLIDLALAMVFFERLRIAFAAPAAIGCGLALAAALAATGAFEAWPYAVLAALAVVLGVLASSLLRRQRQPIDRLLKRLRPRRAEGSGHS